MKIAFGEKYVDKVTGFVGVATAVTKTIHGNKSVCLERPDNEGKPEDIWLPKKRLTPHKERKVGL